MRQMIQEGKSAKKRGRKPTCECGECQNCKARVRALAWYRANAGRDEVRGRYAENARKWRALNRDKARAMRPGHPMQKSAWNAVAYALKVGRIVRQPCEMCGSEDVHAHHEDYSKPLNVRWLCPLHHGMAERS